MRYSFDPERPWRGYGPLQVALLAGRLSSETVSALADESSGPRGAFLPLPVDGADPSVAELRADIQKAKGHIVTTQGGDWDAGATGGQASWMPRRFGAMPGQPLVDLLEMSTREVLAACGVSPMLFFGQQGTAVREAYRLALFATVAPLGQVVAAELRDKLDAPTLELSWADLRGNDLVARSRAVGSLVQAGASFESAAVAAGLKLDAAPMPAPEAPGG